MKPVENRKDTDSWEKRVEVRNADAYPECLKQEMVIADARERKEIIMSQIDELAKKNSWNIVVDPDLLEEVNNLVEYPTVFAGSFDEKYLSVPDAVLITSMKDNQRYFYVEDSDGKLLPHFVSVSKRKRCLSRKRRFRQ